MTKEQKIWVRVMRVWLDEMQARIIEARTSIKTAKRILRANRIQLACHKITVKSGRKKLNKFLREQKKGTR